MTKTSLRPAVLASAALALSAGVLPATAAAAGTAGVGEALIAGGPARGFDVSGLASGFGVVVWVESRSSRGGRLVHRLASLSGEKVKRTAWTRRTPAPTLEVRRELDRRTGRPATRVVERCTIAQDVNCREVLRTPRTLERSTSRFPATAADVASPSAVDGPERVTATTIPSGDAGTGASSCVFTTANDVALPGLPDCATAGLSLQGGLLVASSVVPSRSTADGFVTVMRTDVLDLRAVNAGWRSLGETHSNVGLLTGVQSTCILDGSVVAVRGTRQDGGGVPETWSIAARSLRAGGPEWSAPAPQLATQNTESPAEIACAGSSVYALIQQVSSDFTLVGSRVVRLRPPG